MFFSMYFHSDRLLLLLLASILELYKHFSEVNYIRDESYPMNHVEYTYFLCNLFHGITVGTRSTHKKRGRASS